MKSLLFVFSLFISLQSFGQEPLTCIITKAIIGKTNATRKYVDKQYVVELTGPTENMKISLYSFTSGEVTAKGYVGDVLSITQKAPTTTEYGSITEVFECDLEVTGFTKPIPFTITFYQLLIPKHAVLEFTFKSKAGNNWVFTGYIK